MSSFEKLHSDAMGGKWSEAFERCKQDRALWTAKITGMGDTVLHMAVSSGEEKVAANMVKFLVEQDDEETWNMNTVLGAKNDRKNTPLHLAAIEGYIRMCRKIGEADPSLIARRNIAGETPLFLAALNGHKKAFLWLHYLYVGSHGVSSTGFAHCIRDNEDTILHCAVAEGHADVAIEIVHLYKDYLNEMMQRNKKGLSPLHLLASKRRAFKSTSLRELPILAGPIYRLWKVNEKNQATTLEELQAMKDKKNYKGKSILVRFRRYIVFTLVGVPAAFLQLTCSDAGRAYARAHI
ncbi:transient receptor potential cation channel subfamily A member 1-like [Neltuma alba]|uniref:transient receptor potential cation channel subfamily A member 1-like n=1 Tax=Neltuma alba TaxID=207710 RepID=UPI0010A3FD58|nr:transient receptor potential cation channel subfamily A member 1-like [Prosopis alba]